MDAVAAYSADLVVMVRFMCGTSHAGAFGRIALKGRVTNIHVTNIDAAFLPGFKGARPYHQAYERGVKRVGAAVHYATADLDEAPIIKQEVIRVDHRVDPASMVAGGRDAAALAPSRAVDWHTQHPVLLNKSRTVVFRQ